MPDALVIHLKRFSFFNKQPIKLNNDVNLPTDGILYLTHNSAVTAQQYPEEKGLKGKYRIKSYIVHEGENIGEGHYKTNLEHENKYYECDDDDLKEAPKEISKKDFLSQTDAYLIVLEKISIKEQNAP